MGFCEKVDATPDISECCQAGLRAIKGADRAKFACDDTRKIEGSVDIDMCVKERYPEENRWDYAVGYDGRVYFVEIHPADTSQIAVMINKLDWLKKWLKSQNSPLRDGSATFHWVASGSVHITRGSSQAKRLAALGVRMWPKKNCKCNRE